MSEQNDKMRLYKELWHASGHQHVESDLMWLKRIRRAQFEKFLLMGFPTSHEENWKYTSLQNITNNQFAVAKPTKFEPSIEQIQKLYLDVPHHRLVFINGHYHQDLSKFFELPRGAVITNIASACKKNQDLVQDYLNREMDSSLCHLNTAFMTDGIFIYIPMNRRIELPVHVIYLQTENHNTSSCHPMMINLRNIIVCEENTQLTLFEDYQSLDNAANFSNITTQIDVAQNSCVNHLKLQNESVNAFHIANMTVVQKQHSSVNSNFYTVGGQLSRDDVNVQLQGIHAECSLNGLYLAKNSQHIDHHAKIEHLTEHTQSNALYKGIIADKSHAVFNGKIIVHKNASKTRASLINKNLLLSTQSQIDTKPDLEIYNDDVQCTHSATVGQLDSEMLFYLRARGIAENLAYEMLTLAFAKQMLDFIPLDCITEKIVDYISSELCHEKNVVKNFLI